MISLYLECGASQQDVVIAELYERGTLGVLELGSGLRAWFDDSVDIQDLVIRYDGEILAEDEQDWAQRTRDSFPPIAIGERFWLVPPWNGDPAPPGRMRLEINPGSACGTGWHQCTQMCLEAMERYVRKGFSVLDVGTGSGILAVAADLLGARLVIGCDVDLDAVRVARERVGDGVFAGTANAVCDAAFDVVVANISAPVVTALLPELRRVGRGVLILSGFSEGMMLPTAIEINERDGWRCIVAE